MAAPREGKRAENLVSSATAPSLDPTKALPSTLPAFLWKAQTTFVLLSMTTKGKGVHFQIGQRWCREEDEELNNSTPLMYVRKIPQNFLQIYLIP